MLKKVIVYTQIAGNLFRTKFQVCKYIRKKGKSSIRKNGNGKLESEKGNI